MSSQVSTWKLLMLKHELDFLDFKLHYNNFKIQQLGVELQAFGLELEKQREVEHATEEIPHLEANEVNFDLPPRYDEYEEQEDDVDKGACEAFTILSTPRMIELKQVEISQEYSSPTKEETTILATPLPPFKLPQISPQKNSLQMSSFLSFDKPSLKVPEHESRTSKEWKTISQNEWESLLIPDEIFKWLVLVFGLAKAKKSNIKIKYRAQELSPLQI